MARRPKPIILPENPVFVIPSYRTFGLSLSEEVAAREAAAHQFDRRVNAFPLNKIVRGSGVPVYDTRWRKPHWFFGRLDQPVSDEEYAAEMAAVEAKRLLKKFGVPAPNQPEPPRQAGPIPTLYLLGTGDRIRGIFTTEDLAVKAGLEKPEEPIYAIRANGEPIYSVYANGEPKDGSFLRIKHSGIYAPGYGKSDPEYKELEALVAEPAVESPAVQSRGLFGKRKKNA